MDPTDAASLAEETADWLSEAASAGAGDGCQGRLLDAIRRGIELRRQWDLVDADAPQRRELIARLATLQNRVHAELAACVAESGEAPAGLSERLLCEIDADDAYLARLLDDQAVASADAALGLECFRDDLHWSGTLAAAAEGRRGVDFFGRVLLEQEVLEQEIGTWFEASTAGRASGDHASETAAISEQLRSAANELKQAVLRRQVEALSARQAQQNCNDWRRAWEAAGRLAMRLPVGDGARQGVDESDRTSTSADDLAAAAEQCRKHVAAGWRESLAACELGERRRSLVEAAESLGDTTSETLTFLEDLTLEESVQSLRVLEEDTRWCLELVQAENDPALQNRAAALRRRQRELAAELMERRLALRMERWFGRRGVAALERLILILLLLFVVLLAVEGPLVRYEERWWPGRGWFEAALAWTDLGICLVFLSEFTLKFSLARPRWLFFRRNWFTMLLPSIPFGFMAYQAHRLLPLVELGESVVLVRFLRYLRLPRMVRWLRVARPLVRAGRLMGFALQASDRMARQMAPLLNRNLVLFERADVDVELPAHREALAGLRERFRYRVPELLAELTPSARESLVRRRIEDMRQMLATAGEEALVLSEPERRHSDRDIPLETLVARLVTATPASVSDRVGRALAQSVSRWCRAFDVLLVRRLPVVRDLVAAGKLASPYETTAAVANRLGMLLRGALDRVYWLADLYGTVTAPQLVDSLGEWMVKGTARPARRFLMLGIAFLAVSYLASLLPFPTLNDLTTSLEKVVGTPLVVLGVACMVPLLLGLWFRQIAGEATDFYSRVAEAQFLSATKQLKHRLAATYHALLHRRVIAPELAWEDQPEGGAALAEGCQPGSSSEAARARVELLWNDFLDGAPFHPSDTKTTTQLLGNLVLVSLRNTRVRLDRARRKQLRRLDLSSGRFSFRGPYLWFHFISRSLAQHTAKLVVDYNAHALTLARLETAEDAAVGQYIEWLSRRMGLPPDGLELPEVLVRRIEQMGDCKAAASGAVEFHSNDFTAIHFLSRDEQLVDEVRRRYGDMVACLMERDRRDNIRRVFRTYPLHYLPRAQRVANLLSIYHRHFEGGKVLLLPLKVLWWTLVLLWRATRLIAQFVAEVLHPTSAELDRLRESDPFVVAQRKIHRMRKPLYLECLRMRADFDPEYLGVMLPGSGVGLRGTTTTPVEADLMRIEAEPHLMDAYRKAAAERRMQVMRFRRWLSNQPAVATTGPAARAMAIAYTVDYNRTKTYLQATERLLAAVNGAEPENEGQLDQPAAAARGRWIGRLWRRARLLRRWARLFAQPAFDEWDGRQRRELRRRVTDEGEALYRATLDLTSARAPRDPRDHATTTLRNVGRDPESWTNQLIVLRTVQTLSVLDLQMYCELVGELGEYDDAPPGFFREAPQRPGGMVAADVSERLS